MTSENAVESGEFPLVEWKDVRDHLVARLMMDDEWIVDGSESLEWWPTPLPMSIRVIDAGTFPDSTENWLRVAGMTQIVTVDEALGRELASEYHSAYPVGALLYFEGAVFLSTIFAFNPRNVSLLAWFHQALLIQASVALDLAAEWMQLEGVEIPARPHPISGERTDVDELVRIYGVQQLNFQVDQEVEARFEALRPHLREAFSRHGYVPGFSNDEVDFYNLGFESFDTTVALQRGAFDFGIGFMRGTELERRLGPSLRITARVLPPGYAFDEEQVTHANEALCDLVGTSVFGYISGPETRDGGSGLWATVPHLTLAEWSNLGPDDFRNSVINAVLHVTAAAQVFRRDVLGIHWP